MRGPPPSTTTSSVTDKAKLWLSKIPYATKRIFLICTILYFGGTLFGLSELSWCLHPGALWSKPYEIYRFFTSSFLHGGLLHYIFNMMSFVPMGSAFEYEIGTAQYIWVVVILFNTIMGLTITSISLGAFFVVGYLDFVRQCGVGISGSIFALLTIRVHLLPPDSRQAVFGLFTVPARLYPWAMLLFLQIMYSQVSFLGHLCGIFVGYIWVYGYMYRFTLSAERLAKIEGTSFLSSSTSLDEWIASPDLGTLPTVENEANANGGGGGGGGGGFFSQLLQPRRAGGYNPLGSNGGGSGGGGSGGGGQRLGSAPPGSKGTLVVGGPNQSNSSNSNNSNNTNNSTNNTVNVNNNNNGSGSGSGSGSGGQTQAFSGKGYKLGG